MPSFRRAFSPRHTTISGRALGVLPNRCGTRLRTVPRPVCLGIPGEPSETFAEGECQRSLGLWHPTSRCCSTGFPRRSRPADQGLWRPNPWDLTSVAEDAIWGESDAFAHDPADDWYHQPRELVFVTEDAIWGEADGFLNADAFAHDPADDWYRQQPDDGPQELTYVDEDTFWSEF